MKSIRTIHRSNQQILGRIQSIKPTLCRSFHQSINQSSQPIDYTKYEHPQAINPSINQLSGPAFRQPIAKKTSTFRTLLVATLIGLLIGGYYWKQQNNGWPLAILTLINQSNKKLSESSNQSLSIEKRLVLLKECEALLRQALKAGQISESSINQSTGRSTNQSINQSESKPFFSLPVLLDPMLPPHLCMKLGEVCMKQGQLMSQSIDQSTNQTINQSIKQSINEKYSDAEKYFLHSLRLLVSEAESNARIRKHRFKSEQRFEKTPMHQKPKKQPINQSKPIYDPRVVLVSLQLGDLYRMMGDYRASEGILLRCFQITEEMVARNQSINQSNNPNINRSINQSSVDQSNNQSSVIPPDCDLSQDEVLIVGSDGLSLITESISQVFRDQSIYEQSINWAQQSLAFNQSALEQVSPANNQSIRQSNNQTMNELEHSLLIDRLFRQLNLFTALSNDYYQAAHKSINQSIRQSNNQSVNQLMEMSYKAATHAIDTFQRLIDQSINDSKVSPKHLSSPQFINQSANQSLTQKSNSRDQSYIPINQSNNQSTIQSMIDNQSINQLMKSPPSVQRDALLTECAAVFANLGTILAVNQSINQSYNQSINDLKAVFGVAERAARLSGNATVIQTVAQQKQDALNQSINQ